MCARPPIPAHSVSSSQLTVETCNLLDTVPSEMMSSQPTEPYEMRSSQSQLDTEPFEMMSSRSQLDTELSEMRSSQRTSDAFLVLPPIRATSFHETSLAELRLSPSSPLGLLRSVQSGPPLLNGTLRGSQCTGSDCDTSASCSGSCSGRGAQGACSAKGRCSSGGTCPTNVTRGSSRTGGSCASTREPASGNKAEPRLPTAGAAAPVATQTPRTERQTEGVPSVCPGGTPMEEQLLTRQPVVRVSSRRVMKRKELSGSSGNISDASKPTFGDLEDLWRKDSEARNYCSFVCSAPAMCRSGKEGVVDATPLPPGLVADFSRRKRFRMSADMRHAKTSNPVALLV